MSRIVIALGGNALGKNPTEQLALVKNTASVLVGLVKSGHELIIAHGNGPQVGMINLAFDVLASSNEGPEMPFPECGALSQGYIGYHLQNAIQAELRKNQIEKTCASVITQVEVNKDDRAFSDPSKPIGMFYDEQTANKLAKAKGFVVKEDSGRGYRRVVASPKPQKIVETAAIQNIIDAKNLVICCGGGGIPVYKEGDNYVGIPAVIDKDFASELVAETFDADFLIILTSVEYVSINYGKADQEDLKSITVEQAKTYIEQGQFGAGSMLPKVEACVKFASSRSNRIALVASLDKANDAIQGLSGTRITN